MSKAKIRDERIDDLVFSEISVLQRMEHQNVVKLVEIVEDTFQFYLVMEILDGKDLLSYLKDGRNSIYYNEQQAAKIVKQMLEGLNYMHKLGIIHRDIKLANIVKTSNDKDDLDVKIVDLGFAKFLKNDSDETDFCGSP